MFQAHPSDRYNMLKMKIFIPAGNIVIIRTSRVASTTLTLMIVQGTFIFAGSCMRRRFRRAPTDLA